MHPRFNQHNLGLISADMQRMLDQLSSIIEGRDNLPVQQTINQVQSNIENKSTSFRHSMIPTILEANKAVPTKPATAQSNEANISTSFRPSMTVQSFIEANKVVPPKPATVLINEANRSTSFRPSMTVQSCIEANNVVPTKPAIVQSRPNEANRSTSFRPSMTVQSFIEANKVVPTKPATVQSNDTNRSTSSRPSMTVQSCIDANKVVPTKPATVQSNDTNRSTSSRPSMTVQTCIDANKVVITKPAKVQSSAANTTTGTQNNTYMVASTPRKRSREMNIEDAKRQRLSLQLETVHLPSPSTNPEPQPGRKHSLDLYSSLYGVLTCSICNTWMTRDQIKMCGCKAVCMSCALPMTKCEDCHITLEQDIRLVNFHQRIAKQIVRPCKYIRDGCVCVMKPGDQHEASCEYQPVACDKCKEYVSKALMKDHFEAVHFLKTKNLDVKFADFYLDASGTRKIKCVTNQGLIVSIFLWNMDSEEFKQFTVVYPITDLNVSVKLNFIRDGYMYPCTGSKPQNRTRKRNPISFIDVDKKIFRDWVKGKCRLDIDVLVRKKPQNKTQQKKKRLLRRRERERERRTVAENVERGKCKSEQIKMRNEQINDKTS